MHRIDVAIEPPAGWIWDGYIAGGTLTLLTGRRLVGKTTLLTGLLRSLADGRPFLGRPCTPARALVVACEPIKYWRQRLQVMPVGAHAQLLANPFRWRPTADQWRELIDHAASLRQAGELDLLAIDPLEDFLTARDAGDPAALQVMFGPLRPLLADGVAVLLLHRVRSSADRGPGPIAGRADIVVELGRFGRRLGEMRRRKLSAVSRYSATPDRLYYQWDPATGVFEELGDPHARRFHDHWPGLTALLSRQAGPATHRELLTNWPADQPRPSSVQLYEWLNQATAEGLVRRTGTGRKTDPYRYELPEDGDRGPT